MEVSPLAGKPAPASVLVNVPKPQEKDPLDKLSPEQFSRRDLAGEKIEAVLTHAPGNDTSIGGIMVVAENGWFAARPSGTESIYKICAESFLGEDHLRRVLEGAEAAVNNALKSATSYDKHAE